MRDRNDILEKNAYKDFLFLSLRATPPKAGERGNLLLLVAYMPEAVPARGRRAPLAEMQLLRI